MRKVRFTKRDIITESKWNTPIGNVEFIWENNQNINILVDSKNEGTFTDKQVAVDFINKLILGAL